MHIRFKIIIDCESDINAIDLNYDSEDSILTGITYKEDTPVFNRTNRSKYGKDSKIQIKTMKYLVKIVLFRLVIIASINASTT